MKKTFTLLVCLTLLGCNTNQTETKLSATIKKKQNSEFETHIDKLNGFKIDYPSNWDTTKKDQRITFMATENNPDTSDKFNEGLNITIFPMEGMTLEQMVDKNIEMAKQYYGNPDIKKAKTINANGLDCFILQMKQERHGLLFVTYSGFFENNSKLYTITLTIEANKINKYKPIINSVLHSFDWT